MNLSWSGVLVLFMFISFIIGFTVHFVIRAVTRRPEPTWKPTIPRNGDSRPRIQEGVN
jgi:hypothetical protein